MSLVRIVRNESEPPPLALHESKWRSVVKTLSWRFLATVITMAIVYIGLGDHTLALKVGLADTSVKLLVYFVHERVWQRLSFGLIPRKPTDYQI